MSSTTTGAGTTVVTESIEADNVAFRDINQYYTKDRMVSVHFDEHDEEYPSPNYLQDLLQMLREKRIVLISDEEMITKTDFARHLAKQLVSIEKYSEMEVVEILREGENQNKRVSLTDVLEEEDCTEKVTLLYDVHPEKIDYHFDKLVKQTTDQSCMFIITVNGGFETWMKAGKMVKDFWFQIPEGPHYSKKQLQDLFVLKLKQNPPFFLENETFEDDFSLSTTIKMSDAISRLTSIDQVQLFVRYYSGLSEIPGDYRLNELIKTLLQGNEQMVRSWFYQLDHRCKILAISAALFDGMLIDQYLEALNKITDSSFWETSEPSLKAVDYFNLSFLDAFFSIHVKDGVQYLISKSLSSKSILIELGKLEYRRHFKTAFHQFYEMADLSYATRALNWDLYGTNVKRVWIRKSFTEALRITGTLEFELVENHLLKLAATGHRHLQNICAKSMAQWRLTGHDDLFFTTLKNWQEDESITKRIQELFSRNTEETSTSKTDAIDLIKATAVLALGQASYYDAPNKLHAEIIKGMLHFAKEPLEKEKVAKNIRDALPRFIHHHSLQLEHEIYEELMPIHRLKGPIVDGLLLAIGNYPEQVSSALQRWFKICMEESSLLNRRNVPTYRDSRLIIVLEVLIKADLSENTLFTLESLYTDFLIPLIVNEKRGEVVEYVLQLLAKIQSQDYELATRFSKETIGKLTKKQRIYLVERWGETYLQQRMEMEDTETFTVKNKEYAMWASQKSRPLTAIEKTLYEWVEGDVIKRRLATLVFLEIENGYDRYERMMLQQVEVEKERLRKEEQQRYQSPAMIKPGQQMPSEVNLHLFLRVRIFFYFLFSSNQNKFILKDTLLLFLNTSKYSSDDLRMLIRRWKNSEQKGLTNKLAKWLNNFF